MWSPSSSHQRSQNTHLIQQFHNQRAAERLSRNLQAENEDFASRYWGNPNNSTTRGRVERWVHDERGRRLEVYVTPPRREEWEQWEEYRGEDEIEGQEQEEEVRGRRSPSPPPPYQRVEIPPRDARGDGRDDGGCSSRHGVDGERPVREERVRDREGSDGRDREATRETRGRRRYFFGKLGKRETSGQRWQRLANKRFLRAMGY